MQNASIRYYINTIYIIENILCNNNVSSCACVRVHKYKIITYDVLTACQHSKISVKIQCISTKKQQATLVL